MAKKARRKKTRKKAPPKSGSVGPGRRSFDAQNWSIGVASVFPEIAVGKLPRRS